MKLLITCISVFLFTYLVSSTVIEDYLSELVDLEKEIKVRLDRHKRSKCVCDCDRRGGPGLDGLPGPSGPPGDKGDAGIEGDQGPPARDDGKRVEPPSPYDDKEYVELEKRRYRGYPGSMGHQGETGEMGEQVVCGCIQIQDSCEVWCPAVPGQEGDVGRTGKPGLPGVKGDKGPKADTPQ